MRLRTEMNTKMKLNRSLPTTRTMRGRDRITAQRPRLSRQRDRVRQPSYVDGLCTWLEADNLREVRCERHCENSARETWGALAAPIAVTIWKKLHRYGGAFRRVGNTRKD